MTISEEDKQTIIQEINQLYDKMNPLIRMAIPSLPSLLKQIPASARKYTVEELIEFLEEAHQNHQIP